MRDSIYMKCAERHILRNRKQIGGFLGLGAVVGRLGAPYVTDLLGGLGQVLASPLGLTSLSAWFLLAPQRLPPVKTAGVPVVTQR